MYFVPVTWVWLEEGKGTWERRVEPWKGVAGTDPGPECQARVWSGKQCPVCATEETPEAGGSQGSCGAQEGAEKEASMATRSQAKENEA